MAGRVGPPPGRGKVAEILHSDISAMVAAAAMWENFAGFTQS